MENCTQTQAVGGLRTVISPQQFKTKRLQHPKETADAAGQRITKEHMGYRDDKTAQVRIKQLSLLDRGLEKTQLYRKSLISINFGCDMLKTKISPSVLGYRRSPPHSWASSSLSVIQALQRTCSLTTVCSEPRTAEMGTLLCSFIKKVTEFQHSSLSMHFVFNRKQKNSQAEVTSNPPKRAPELSILMAS